MASVNFYLDHPKKSGTLKNTPVKVTVKFSIDRDNRYEVSTGESILPKSWDFKKQRVRGNVEGSFEFNDALEKIKADLLKIYREDKTQSIDQLKEKAKPLIKFGQTTAPEKKSLLVILDSFINQSKKEKDSKTVAKYHSLKVKLTEFNPKLTIGSTDNNFYDKFKNHLFEKGLLDSSVYKYFTNLSTVLTWADSRGHEIHHTNGKPTHKSWKIIKRRYEPITLTMAELQHIETLHITQELIEEKLPAKKHGRTDQRLDSLLIIRDCIILECRTGQRISDLKKFDMKDVIGSVWHNQVTKGKRLGAKVTKVPFNTTFTAPAWEILRKYGFSFPTISEQKLNAGIKKVCQVAGINSIITKTRWDKDGEKIIQGPKYKFLTNHTGRRTFITIGLQFLKPKQVKDLAGISWNTLKYYEGQSEDQTLIDGLNSIPVSPLKIAQ